MVTKSDMRKGFAYWPVKLRSGKRVWLQSIYYRFCEDDTFGSPDCVEWFEYFTPEEASILILKEQTKVAEFVLPLEQVVIKLTKTSMILLLLLLYFAICLSF